MRTASRHNDGKPAVTHAHGLIKGDGAKKVIMPPLPAEAARRLSRLLSSLEHLAPSFVGYPCSQDFDYPEIRPFLKFALNNVGDPFGESIYRENTFAFEREVIGFFQKHLRAPPQETWGYMTAGGTEGNLY